jgi:hypothetical protein
MRKTLTYTVADEGRDKGKSFLITEMPVDVSEKWAMRAILAMVNSGHDVPQSALNGGFGALVEIGFKGLFSIKWELLEPLLDEMMTCLQVIPDIRSPHVVRALFPEDIEEIATLPKLRWVILKLHADFLEPVAQLLSKRVEAAAGKVSKPTKTRRKSSAR